MAEGPVLPDYGGACVANVVPALLGRRHDLPPWAPAPLAGAAQAVLLVVDGLGWEQLQERRHLAPNLCAMEGGPITTVVPSTTATALTSLTTGRAPAQHGIVGYRLLAGPGQVLNVLRWTTPEGDCRVSIAPERMQPLEPFLGAKPPVVTKAEFAGTGFTRAHLAGSELRGWRYPSTLVAHVADLVRDGQNFVYAYYPGLDTVAHEHGLGHIYEAELAAVDRLVGDLLAAVGAGTVVAVVSDHGQVEVGERVVPVHPEVSALTASLSGEGRFRWFHAWPGQADALRAAAALHHGDLAWAVSRAEVVAGGWMGGPLAPDVAARLGDVALVARAPVAFVDPADRGPFELVCRHGSLTSAEMWVPFVAARA
ncbi:MAG: alkaline phosphatase family protein [Actinomycetota bacterium]